MSNIGLSLTVDPIEIHPNVSLSSTTQHNLTIYNNETSEVSNIYLESEFGWYSNFSVNNFSLNQGQSQLVIFQLETNSEQGKYDENIKIYKNNTLDFIVDADFRNQNDTNISEETYTFNTTEIERLLEEIKNVMDNQTLTQEQILEQLEKSLEMETNIGENALMIIIHLDNEDFELWQKSGDLQNLTGLTGTEFNLAVGRLGQLQKIMQDTRTGLVPIQYGEYQFYYPSEVIYYASVERVKIESVRATMWGVVSAIIILIIIGGVIGTFYWAHQKKLNV